MMNDLIKRGDVLKLATTIYDEHERPHLVVPVKCIRAIPAVNKSDAINKEAERRRNMDKFWEEFADG